MVKYFEKYETLITILLIIIYIVSNSYCMQNFGGTIDYRTAVINFILSLSIILFILKNKLTKYYGLTKLPRFKKH